MTSINDNRFYREPSHDEIALSAFLAWERDGRPENCDVKYWLEAEARLREQRRKQAEVAAAEAAKPWPPSSRGRKSTAAKAPKLSTDVERGTAVKVKMKKTSSAVATRRPSLKSSR